MKIFCCFGGKPKSKNNLKMPSPEFNQDCHLNTEQAKINKQQEEISNLKLITQHINQRVLHELEPTSTQISQIHQRDDQTLSVESRRSSQCFKYTRTCIYDDLYVQATIKKIKDLRQNTKSYSESKKLEKEFVYRLIGLPQEKNNFVEAMWAIKYTQFLDGKGLTKEPIDNSLLILPEYHGKRDLILVYQNQFCPKLRPHLKQDHNYVLVNDIVWKFIVGMYGGGPEIRVCNDDLVEIVIQFDEIPQEDNFDKGAISLYSYEMRKSFLHQGINQFFQLPVLVLPVVGLKNQRFFCYANCIIQVLMSIAQLNAFIISRPQSIDDRKIITQYQKYLKLVEKSSFRQIINPKDFYSIFQSRFASQEQQDCQEFLLYFLEKIEEELTINVAQKQNQFGIRANIISQIFRGVTLNTITCKNCFQVSKSQDIFFDLSLPLEKKGYQKQCELSECLKAHFKDYYIEDTWVCEKCQKKQIGIKRSSIISEPPNVMILHLKRFQNYPSKQKLSYPLLFSQQIDISDVCLKGTTNTVYNLQSAIIHFGKIDSGHYTAVTLRDGKWYHLDDQTISQLTSSQVLRLDQAYLLIYERQR